jgi:glycosyltransferase involved in cell wall biosynthesis
VAEAGGDPSAPEIAVVIPTRGRETRLAFALEALAQQRLDPSRFEVVVVRDGDATEPLAQAPPGIAVRFLTRPGIAGPTAKRNVGWRASSAPLVAFTDDDCRADPRWLESLLAAASGTGSFLQGRTEPDPDERRLLHGFARSQEIRGLSGWYETCNMAYPRELLERLGGFDESFPFGGEDTDLAYRAIEAGARPVYVDDALVWHAVMHRSLGRALREATAWSEMSGVVARHPELRDALYLGAFWRKSHAALLLALAGAAVARRRPGIALAAALPYLELRVNWRSPSARRLARRLATLPAWVAIDAVEVASRLPAAVRHRTLVI